jgi:iron(III) transport system permease protein
VGKGWALTPLPVAYTLRYYDRVIIETAEVHHEQLPLLRASRSCCASRSASDRLAPGPLERARAGSAGRDQYLILAIPGTAIGIAYVRAFHFDVPGFDRGLTSFWIIMPLVLAVRRLPYTVRGSLASLLLVHRSLEKRRRASAPPSFRASGRHLAADLEGHPGRQLVLVHDLAPGSLGRVVPGTGGMGVHHQRHLRVLHRGSANEAAALGVILIAVATVSVVLINRIAGRASAASSARVVRHRMPMSNPEKPRKSAGWRLVIEQSL